MNPKLSIVVPVYNTEKYLPRCIDSVLAQTFSDFELILVNDGTKDNSLEICEAYAAKDPRIKVISQENQGLSAARNFGVKHAAAEYIAFIDSDDYVHPQMYEKLYEAVSREHTDFVKCGFVHVMEKDCYTYSEQLLEYAPEELVYAFRPEKSHLDEKDYLTALSTQTGWSSAVNGIYSKELLLSVPFRMGWKMEDWAFHLDCCKTAFRACVIPDALYYYVYRVNSILHSGDLSILMYNQKLRMEAFRLFAQQGDTANASDNYSQSMFYFFLYFEKGGYVFTPSDELTRCMRENIRYCNNITLKMRIQLYLLSPGLYAFLFRILNRTILNKK